jgi:diguanylate cyclase (GGDEF)-like protein
MVNKDFKISQEFLECTRSEYLDNKLAASKKQIKTLILIVASVNLALIIPDFLLVARSSSIGIIIMRVVFSLGLLLLYTKIKIITFKLFIIVTTAAELSGIGIFLYVLTQYNEPNLLIQTLGLIIISILVFLVPNRWQQMIVINAIAAICFFLCIIFIVGNIDWMEFTVSVFYVAIAMFLGGFFTRNTELLQHGEFVIRQRFERLSTTDYLTKTANRLKLEEEAERWINFCQRKRRPLSMVYFDIDNLKMINDTYGHATGDVVLISLTSLIRKQLRHYDILSRMGGDEFVLLLPDISLDNAIIFTERIRKSIEENTFDNNISLTCSFGIVAMKEDSSFTSMILEADQLMYTGKKLGKNHIQWKT